MRGRNLGFLWDRFGGNYLATMSDVRRVLGLGYSQAVRLLEGCETLAIGKGTYYRTMDVIDVVENNFERKR